MVPKLSRTALVSPKPPMTETAKNGTTIKAISIIKPWIGAELTIAGFTATYGGWSSIFTAMALCCFAFSTIIGWGLYGSRCAEFLFRTDKVVGPFLVLYSFVSIVGATMDLGLLWNIADTFNGLMSIPNLIALLLLSGTVAKLVKEFFAGEGAR